MPPFFSRSTRPKGHDKERVKSVESQPSTSDRPQLPPRSNSQFPGAGEPTDGLSVNSVHSAIHVLLRALEVDSTGQHEQAADLYSQALQHLLSVSSTSDKASEEILRNSLRQYKDGISKLEPEKRGARPTSPFMMDSQGRVEKVDGEIDLSTDELPMIDTARTPPQDRRALLHWRNIMAIPAAIPQAIAYQLPFSGRRRKTGRDGENLPEDAENDEEKVSWFGFAVPFVSDPKKATKAPARQPDQSSDTSCEGTEIDPGRNGAEQCFFCPFHGHQTVYPTIHQTMVPTTGDSHMKIKTRSDHGAHPLLHAHTHPSTQGCHHCGTPSQVQAHPLPYAQTAPYCNGPCCQPFHQYQPTQPCCPSHPPPIAHPQHAPSCTCNKSSPETTGATNSLLSLFITLVLAAVHHLSSSPIASLLSTFLTTFITTLFAVLREADKEYGLKEKMWEMGLLGVKRAKEGDWSWLKELAGRFLAGFVAAGKTGSQDNLKPGQTSGVVDYELMTMGGKGGCTACICHKQPIVDENLYRITPEGKPSQENMPKSRFLWSHH